MLRQMCCKALFVVAFLAVLGLGSGVSAQDAAPASGEASVAKQWGDFIHYIKVLRPEAALANGQAILTASPAVDPSVIYKLSLAEGAQTALNRAERVEGLAPTVKAMRALIEKGHKMLRRDHREISRSIELLGGSLRQYIMASERLAESGEYAVTQLVREIGNPEPKAPINRIIPVLLKIGKEAVRPLSSALATENPAVRQIICQTLGQIGYWHSAPYLRALVDDASQTDDVRKAAKAALIAVTDDPEAAAKPLANYLYELAERYYTKQESLLPDMGETLANYWYWDDSGLGLTFKEVPTAIFTDAYAMRAARQALQANPEHERAVSLWLGANLRKEARLPQGKTDPTRGASQISAAAYAKAAGARYMQAVLERALRDRDSDVASGAIKALATTVGAVNLVKPTAGGATPLVAALGYPDRRVRFMAAEALANARPQDVFVGSDLVIPVLVEAVRQTGIPTVLLVDTDNDRRNTRKDWTRQGGFEVVDAGHFGPAIEAANKATGLDVVVLSSSIAEPAPAGALAMLRANPAFANLPIVLVGEDDGAVAAAKRLARENEMVVAVAGSSLDAAGWSAAIAEAAKTASGDVMPAGEAAKWALIASNAIGTLGMTRTTVYDVLRAEPALTAGLQAKSDEQKVASAKALAMLASSTAQQAIVSLASASEPGEQVRVAAYLAAAGSVRQFGSRLTDAQIGAIVELVNADAAPMVLRDAASGLLGALDLPSKQVESLITK